MFKINIDKCCQISFTRLKHPLTTNHTINKIPLSMLSSIKDLNVILSNNFLFDDHLDIINKKARKMLVFVNRN